MTGSGMFVWSVSYTSLYSWCRDLSISSIQIHTSPWEGGRGEEEKKRRRKRGGKGRKEREEEERNMLVSLTLTIMVVMYESDVIPPSLNTVMQLKYKMEQRSSFMGD